MLFSIWVSFAEIYNERVYDLFQVMEKGKKRKELKLMSDKEGQVYIKGSCTMLLSSSLIYIFDQHYLYFVFCLSNQYHFLASVDLTEIPVNSADEAYEFFLAGKMNLRFAATSMNSNSSRSHSFFNLRVVAVGVSNGTAYPKKIFRYWFPSTFC